MKVLQTPGSDSLSYTHHESLDDMYAALRQVVQDELDASRNESPYPYYALEVDEAYNRSKLVVYFRFINKDGKFYVIEHVKCALV